MSTSSPTIDASSIGMVASMLQRHPSTLQAIADSMEIKPLLTLNGIPFYSVADIERLAERIRSEDLAR